MLVFKFWNEANEPCKVQKTAYNGYEALKVAVNELRHYYLHIEVYLNEKKVVTI